MAANEDYFLGAPKTANLEMRVVPEKAPRVTPLKREKRIWHMQYQPMTQRE